MTAKPRTSLILQTLAIAIGLLLPTLTLIPLGSLWPR